MLLYMIYRHAFGVNPKRLAADDEVPKGDEYKEYAKSVHNKIEQIKKVPFEEVRIKSRDGVELYGRYYHRKDDAPVLLIHGEDDSFVPCEMSQRNYDACTSEKEILIVSGADHGMSYMTDTPKYVATFKGFLQKHFESDE